MRRLGCLLALILLSACSMTPPPAPQQSPSGSMPAPSEPVGTPTALPDPRLSAIAADLRKRGVTGYIVVVDAENVRFDNGALGCPKPGVQYTQAQVDGMRVLVEVGGRRYDYRFGRTDTPVLCERPSPGAIRSSR